MTQIIIIAIIYALLRSKHDSFIPDGQWKLYAVLEAIFLTGLFTSFIGNNIIDYLFLPVIFGIWFSISFDIFCGWFRAKKIFYFGSGVYDRSMQSMFIKPVNFFVFKVIWLILISGAYNELIKMY